MAGGQLQCGQTGATRFLHIWHIEISVSNPALFEEN